MTIFSLLLFVFLGAVAGAVAAWVIAGLKVGWTARGRVFNSASIAPSVFAMGAAAFAVVLIIGGGDYGASAAKDFLVHTIIAVLAAFNGGMVAAYLIERRFRQ